MTRLLAIFAISLCALPGMLVATGSAESVNLVAARQIVQEFQQLLSTELKQAISSGGPEAAISVCSTQAQKIASTVGTKHQVLLKRVSGKPRNRLDTPDSQDAAVLAEFAKAMANNHEAPLEKLITLQNGAQRYYKAITIQPLCLTCHGTELPPAVQTSISAHYPDDKATGYAEGDLRGTFVVEFPAKSGQSQQ